MIHNSGMSQDENDPHHGHQEKRDPIESLAHTFLEQTRQQDLLKQRLREEIGVHQKTRAELDEARRQLSEAQGKLQHLFETTGEMACKRRENEFQITELNQLAQSEGTAKRALEQQVTSMHRENSEIKSEFVERTRAMNNKIRAVTTMYQEYVHSVTTGMLCEQQQPTDRVAANGRTHGNGQEDPYVPPGGASIVSSGRILELQSKLLMLESVVDACESCSMEAAGEERPLEGQQCAQGGQDSVSVGAGNEVRGSEGGEQAQGEDLRNGQHAGNDAPFSQQEQSPTRAMSAMDADPFVAANSCRTPSPHPVPSGNGEVHQVQLVMHERMSFSVGGGGGNASDLNSMFGGGGGTTSAA